ncbi:MAG: putative transcriptional regulator [Anaerocolumna sp.]|jgi:DNA-binding transcriptional MerR regulator|nr:putative transcriptional regulator [Anaerocolumna sp.]
MPIFLFNQVDIDARSSGTICKKGGGYMDLIKITDLTTQLDISSRSLRYYEQMGLIQSIRPDFEKYRYYDADTIERLKQIMVLRKMQIPIKDIIRIYESDDMSVIVETFVNRIKVIDDEVTALSELKRIVNEFLQIMIRNGIKKISALPLIFDEMGKEYEILEEHKPITFEELKAVDEKLTKPLDIRIMELPTMRVLSSYLHENKRKSDTDLFQKWLAQNNILTVGTSNGDIGKHERFDYIDTETNEYVCILKITDDFDLDSPFVDFTFVGELFAGVGAYQGDDMGQAYDNLKSYIENKSESFMIDYPYINQTHIDCLGEEVLSLYDDKARYELYMPVKRRVNIDETLDDMSEIENITISELEKCESILTTENIDLNTMVSEAWEHNMNDIGELHILANMDFQGSITPQKYKIPFRVDVVIKAETDNSIRLYWGKGAVILNWENNESELRVQDPFTGRQYGFQNKGGIPIGEYVKLTWIVGNEYLAVIVNDEIRHIGKKYPYTRTLRSLDLSNTIRIGSNSKDLYTSFVLRVKSLKISKLMQKTKIHIKKGALTIMQRQSNNILPKLRPQNIGYLGENYPFNGSMRYLMECIGRDDLSDYWLSAHVNGDAYTFVYSPYKGGGGDTCVTERLFSDEDETYIKSIFQIYGYECTYITKKQINENKQLFIDMVMNYIDKGIPVITAGFVRAICGYEDNGKTLLTLEWDSLEPVKFNTEQEIDGLLFIGDKKREVSLDELCIKAITGIPNIYCMEKEGVYFGHKGLYKWADDIENGKYDNFTKKNFDVWEYYTVYIVNIATNVSGVKFGFDRPNDLPNLYYKEHKCENYESFLNEMNLITSEMNTLYQQLSDIGGAFNITLKALQDKQNRKQIADKIREIGKVNERILSAFELLKY